MGVIHQALQYYIERKFYKSNRKFLYLAIESYLHLAIINVRVIMRVRIFLRIYVLKAFFSDFTSIKVFLLRLALIFAKVSISKTNFSIF